AGLLQALQSRFAIFIEEEHKSRCRAEVQHLRMGINVAQRLANVRRRLADGITRGFYRILPEPMNAGSGRNHALLNDPLCAPVLELLQVPQTAGAWVSIDDRYFTSFTYVNTNPIVSTFEVLRHLASKQQLDDTSFYHLLDRMRASRIQV